jgi:hypothetical protein
MQDKMIEAFKDRATKTKKEIDDLQAKVDAFNSNAGE